MPDYLSGRQSNQGAQLEVGMSKSKVREGRSRTSGVAKAPSWFPLETYGRELSYAQWAAEIFRRHLLITDGWEWLKSGDVSFLKALTCDPKDVGVDISFPDRLTSAVRVYINDDRKILHPQTDFETQLILSIDVSAKDSEIASAVKELVELRRLEINGKVKAKRPGNLNTRIKRWKKNRLLEVFDLWMWSEINGNCFTWAEIEEIVFGDEYDEKARKTSMEEAKSTINPETIKALMRAASEMEQQGKS